jgi:hypothetical protein
MKTVLFHVNQFSLRGTEVAVYDYAHFNELLLKNRSVIASHRQSPHHPDVVKKFSDRFEIYYYDNLEELQKIVTEVNADVFYALKPGLNDGVVLNNVKNCIHVVFCHYQPHGDVYAYISEWLTDAVSDSRQPWVPHIVSLPEIDGDLREELGIPADATVYGRYGGIETFDIPFVKREIYKVAASRPDLYFIFMNTENFLIKKRYFLKKRANKILSPWLFHKRVMPNIIFLEGSSNIAKKVNFINTCDAMLHARTQGESFGIACGEFSILNKPVITCNADWVPERNHIVTLKKKGLYYSSAKELRDILNRFEKRPTKNWDAYTEQFNPTSVMAKFKTVFLD